MSTPFQSLARAVVAADGSLFDPGEANVDWRLHAHYEPGIDDEDDEDES